MQPVGPATEQYTPVDKKIKLTFYIVLGGVMARQVVVYMSPWCGSSADTQRALKEWGVPATFVNIKEDRAAAARLRGWVGFESVPTIIIAARAAIRSVPPSIKEAALGIGASHQQAVFHHVLPLAVPGILTGTILGVARALGETAPLLMIGMKAFIVDIPSSPLSPAAALPVQIYIWADSPERGFVSRTSAAILVLLGFLVLMIGIAIFLRQRFERRW